MKWGFCAAEKADQKYIICNADEGEPGTFKDRVILTRFADLVFEGMTIGGRAIGASLGIIYLRAEYTYLRPHLNEVIQRRRAAGLLGPQHRAASRASTSTSSWPWAPAPTCAARRRPSSRASRASAASRATARRSRWSPACSTTRRWSTTSRRSPRWRRSSPRAPTGSRRFGTDKSTGYKLFSISGDCEKPGVYEFPWGITVADLLEEVGGERRQGRPDRRRQRRLRARPGTSPARSRSRTSPPAARSWSSAPTATSSTWPRTSSTSSSRRAAASAPPAVWATSRCSRRSSCSRRVSARPSSSPSVKALGATMQVASKCGLGQTSPSAFLSILEGFGDEIANRAPSA